MDESTRYRQQKESELHTWEAQLDQWRSRDESADGDPELRREQQQMLDDLHAKRMEARNLLDALARGGDSTALTPQIERLWADIRQSIQEIQTWA